MKSILESIRENIINECGGFSGGGGCGSSSSSGGSCGGSSRGGCGGGGRWDYYPSSSERKNYFKFNKNLGMEFLDTATKDFLQDLIVFISEQKPLPRKFTQTQIDLINWCKNLVKTIN